LHQAIGISCKLVAQPNSGITREAQIDETHDHYQLIFLGWDRPRRVHAVIIHMRLYNGKIWLEYDGTDVHIAQQLVAAGVPKDDIVLAFHPPDVRPHTGYAVA
jgi:hypothetical protein